MVMSGGTSIGIPSASRIAKRWSVVHRQLLAQRNGFLNQQVAFQQLLLISASQRNCFSLMFTPHFCQILVNVDLPGEWWVVPPPMN